MEALIIPAVLVVAVAVYLSARFGLGDLPVPTTADELKELRGHRDELRAKLQRAGREGWDAVMTGQVQERLDDIEQRIARLEGRP
ncbi:MAG TPA: hypothetical protein VG936_10490 [Lacunisphaera sp.]|nr:hypothetical protein [Lacunisphaera sp.]